jgi:acyl carrier protein
MDAREAIRAFVKDLLASKGETAAFEDSESLLLNGRLQSIDAVEIALFLEQEYAIDFSVVGFDQAQIDSVDAIVSLVEQHGRRIS